MHAADSEHAYESALGSTRAGLVQAYAAVVENVLYTDTFDAFQIKPGYCDGDARQIKVSTNLIHHLESLLVRHQTRVDKRTQVFFVHFLVRLP